MTVPSNLTWTCRALLLRFDPHLSKLEESKCGRFEQASFHEGATGIPTDRLNRKMFELARKLADLKNCLEIT